jgi:hypothetical protein
MTSLYGSTSGVGFTGYNQTNRQSLTNVSGGRRATLIGDAAGASTVNFSATAPGSAAWGAMAVPLLP